MSDKERPCGSGVCVSHFGNVRRHEVVQCVEIWLVYGLFLPNNCEKKNTNKNKLKKKRKSIRTEARTRDLSRVRRAS